MAKSVYFSGGRASYSNSYTSSRPAILGLAKIFFLAICQASYASAAPLLAFVNVQTEKDDAPEAEDPSLWLYLGVAAILVLLGGAFAGLTIALMGQDGVYLQVIATSGEGKEQRHAQKVYGLLNKGKHWVLVTLLLSNVIVNETLPIVLDRSLGGGWPAVLGSTALIVIFGEVIPQSICVRYGLSIGAYMAPFVLGLMWILAPIAWPTAKLLDTLLGEDHGTVYKKSGLKTLVTLHKTLGSTADRLNQDEVTIISAVLDLKEKPIGDIMTPMEDVFTMSADTVLDEQTMNVILGAGYSRIPIYEPGNEQNFIGMLLVKILITYDPEDCKKVGDFALATLPETRAETSCLDIVNFFQEGKSHMVLVSDNPGENYGATGVVTLEDVIEELIGEEIIDESDVYIDVHKAIRRLHPAPKARIAKGEIVAQREGQLIDLRDDTPAKLTENSSVETRSTSPAVFTPSSPKTTFLRRTSTGNDTKPVQVRANVNDMREHLKHLGPSNLASRPKTTRYQTVKIKPGHGLIRSESRAESDSHGLETTANDSYLDNPAPGGGEGEGLLKSAGRDASDGVFALQQGYGSMDAPSSSAHGYKDDPVKKPFPLKNDRPSPLFPRKSPSSESLEGKSSSDTVSSLRSRGSSPARKWRAARSGSITENIIEAGGFRKVVLETNNSGDDGDQKVVNGRQKENSPPKSSMSFLNLLESRNNGPEPKEDPAPSVAEQGAKKKRRRKRKKSPTKGGGSSVAGGSTQD